MQAELGASAMQTLKKSFQNDPIGDSDTTLTLLFTNRKSAHKQCINILTHSTCLLVPQVIQDH